MYNIRPTTKFQKDLKRVKKRGFDISLLTDIIKKAGCGGAVAREEQGAPTFRGIIRGVVSATLRRIGC